MDNGKISRETFTKAVVACVISVASLGALSAGDYPTPVTSGLAFEPGQYTASAKGMESDVVVTCTFDDTMLTDISIDVSGETAGIGAEIGEEMSDKVLQAQSAEIDGVSGASVTSEAIKAAVADCIAQATGEAPAAAEEETAAAEEETAAAEEETAAAEEETAAAEEETAAAEEETAAAEEETAAETEAAAEEETEAPAEAAPAAAGDASYVPGEYTASAQGMESEVKVTAVFDESSITDFTVDVSGETAGIGAEIADEITEQILAAQSAEVDGVSGATVTSNAVKTAMADIIAQASGEGAAAEAEEETDAAETEAAEAEEETEAAETEAADAGEETELAEEETELTEDETELASAEGFVPGEYTASAQGMESEVKVTITFDENGMTEASVDVSGETKGIGAEIGDRITEQILEAQSADLDGVTGATVTSTAVKTAVEDILAQASGSAEAETEISAEGFVPGEYTASAQGMESEVVVQITVDETSITDVVVQVDGETQGIGAAIGDEVTQQILDAQSADIDGVSGATVTSNAVKTALEDALAQAAAK